MSDKPEQYVLVLHTTDPESPLYSFPRSYEDCQNYLEQIRKNIAYFPNDPLTGSRYGLMDCFIYPRHVVRVGITPYYD